MHDREPSTLEHMSMLFSRADTNGRRPPIVYVDLTHLGRHVTGIERVTIEQFERIRFRGADVRHVRARGLLGMIVAQQLLLPLLSLLYPRAVFVFPGFPPSPFFRHKAERVVLYVHDLFLLTRKQDLGRKARLYMAWPFSVAVRGLKYFLVNSEKTRAELAPFVRPDASITLYRPSAGNVFGVTDRGRAERPETPRPLKILAVGTIEPRKNYAAAAAIVEHLAGVLPGGAELNIIGRDGWGNSAAALRACPRVRLHGYLSAADARRVVEDCDVYLCTSHDEGLGLPLLEVQYAGLPVVAPDAPVFREVLGQSGTFIDTTRPASAACSILALISKPGWRKATSEAAKSNAIRWNGLAAGDRECIARLFEKGLDGVSHSSSPPEAA
jgi:glycosyltransferase involved in cell wall biosynthesis